MSKTPTESKPTKQVPPHYHGHRARLRERFLDAGIAALGEHEVLELMLFYAYPRIDTKPVAKRLLAKAGGLAQLLNKPPQTLAAWGLSENACAMVRLVAQGGLMMLRHEVAHEDVRLESRSKLHAYCQAKIGHASVEELHIILLDHRYRLLADEIHQRGTINQTPAYPREIVRRALEVGASCLVMAHNHPSNHVEPSLADVEMTHKVQAAAQGLGIQVLDHVIVGPTKIASMKQMGLLGAGMD